MPPCGIGIPGVDGEVEDGAFELIAVGEDVPDAAGEGGLDGDALAERAAQEIGHAGDQLIGIDGFGIERLAPREGEEPFGQDCRALRAPHRRIGQPDEIALRLLHLVGFAPAQGVEIALNDHQQVIEVVGDAAGQLADRLHLLRLAQRLLGLFHAGRWRDRSSKVWLNWRSRPLSRGDVQCRSGHRETGLARRLQSKCDTAMCFNPSKNAIMLAAPAQRQPGATFANLSFNSGLVLFAYRSHHFLQRVASAALLRIKSERASKQLIAFKTIGLNIPDPGGIEGVGARIPAGTRSACSRARLASAHGFRRLAP